MAKKTFIPNWYEDKKNQITNRKIRICIILASVMNILLLSFIFNVSIKTKNIDSKLSNGNNNTSIAQSVKHDITAIEKYKKVSNFFKENQLSYKNIILTKDNMEIDIEVKSYEEYIHVIRCIENSYSIKKLTPNIKNERNFNFKVIL